MVLKSLSGNSEMKIIKVFSNIQKIIFKISYKSPNIFKLNSSSYSKRIKSSTYVNNILCSISCHTTSRFVILLHNLHENFLMKSKKLFYMKMFDVVFCCESFYKNCKIVH